MDPALNPYSPGAGLRPPALAGRDRELKLMDILIRRANADLQGRGVILTGLRGVGKTVLLRELRARAQSAGWLAVQVEGVPGAHSSSAFRKRLARELHSAGRHVATKSPGARMLAALGSISSFSIEAGVTGGAFAVERAVGRADSGDFETDFTELVEDITGGVAEEGRGFALFIDEMQDVDADTLTGILAAQHRAGQERWPFYVVGAGLPSLQRVLSEARSYAERLFEYRTIGPLPPPDAAAALLEPARNFAADYTTPALHALLSASEGYPYFLQEFGRAIWDRAIESPFSALDAQEAIAQGQQHLDDGFYRARWDRATRAERDLLTAMAPDRGGASSTSIVAARMGRSLSANGPARASLISKGLIYAPDHGQVAYTVPGMHHFISRQHD